MRFVNSSGFNVHLPGYGIGPVAPGETVDLEDSLCRPKRAANGGRGPSTIEQIAPQLQPADAAELAAWLVVPAAPAVVSRPVTSETMRLASAASSAPAGVAEVMRAKAKALSEPPAAPSQKAPAAKPAKK